MSRIGQYAICVAVCVANIEMSAAADSVLREALRPDQRAQMASTPHSLPLCTRKDVGFSTVGKEMTSLNLCETTMCEKGKGWAKEETKQIAGYSGAAIKKWLWTSPSQPATMSVATQNAIMQTARNYANANRPAGKIVQGIAYFTDIIPGSDDKSEYLVGAEVRYGQCAAIGPPPS